MIGKLKLKFIILFSISLLIILAVIVTAMNLLNYRELITESDEILEVISENKGQFPDDLPEIDDRDQQKPGGDRRPGSRFSPELAYESRYFTVITDAEGEIRQADLGRIVTVDFESAGSYTESVRKLGTERGTIDNFRYLVSRGDSETRYTFLDIGRKLDSFNSFLKFSIITSLVAFVITSLVFIIVSGKIVRPIAESYEKQKQFISDAGHEIRTPLTVINSNADLIELDYGESDYTGKIKSQVKKLAGLTESLVNLAKMENPSARREMTEFSLSTLLDSAVSTFDSVAKAQSRTIARDIAENVTVKADRTGTGKLLDLILDNAVKYSLPESEIKVALTQKGRGSRLSVSNTCENSYTGAEIKRLFERFYRPDGSRNSSTGGYGIGLSSAKAICDSMGWKISAGQEDKLFTITIDI